MSLAPRILAVMALAALSACDRDAARDERGTSAQSEQVISRAAPTEPPAPNRLNEVEIAGPDGAATALPGASAGHLPLARILAIAREHVPGEVIEVELDDDDGRAEYEVKILTADGRSVEMQIDAVRGTILKSEED